MQLSNLNLNPLNCAILPFSWLTIVHRANFESMFCATTMDASDCGQTFQVPVSAPRWPPNPKLAPNQHACVVVVIVATKCKQYTFSHFLQGSYMRDILWKLGDVDTTVVVVSVYHSLITIVWFIFSRSLWKRLLIPMGVLDTSLKSNWWIGFIINRNI